MAFIFTKKWYEERELEVQRDKERHERYEQEMREDISTGIEELRRSGTACCATCLYSRFDIKECSSTCHFSPPEPYPRRVVVTLRDWCGQWKISDKVKSGGCRGPERSVTGISDPIGVRGIKGNAQCVTGISGPIGVQGKSSTYQGE